MYKTEHSPIELLGFHRHTAADGFLRKVSTVSSWEPKEIRSTEEAVHRPIRTHIVGMADNRFYAQEGRDETLYILPRAAFVTRGRAILADGTGEADVWIPCPQDAPRQLGVASTAIVISLSEGEEDRRCEQVNCTNCRNHECLDYNGPQGRGAPSWHTLSPHGKVARAWTLPR